MSSAASPISPTSRPTSSRRKTRRSASPRTPFAPQILVKRTQRVQILGLQELLGGVKEPRSGTPPASDYTESQRRVIGKRREEAWVLNPSRAPESFLLFLKVFFSFFSVNW
ncbi:hypothetical protein V6Z11_D10G035700 [Gossypium hirsutum]